MVKKKQRLEKDYLHIRGKRRMLKHEEEKIRKDVLLSADVICCTLNASGSAILHKLLKTARYESFLHQFLSIFSNFFFQFFFFQFFFSFFINFFFSSFCNSRGLGGTIVSFSFRTHDIHVKSQSTLYRNLLLFSKYSGFLLQEYQQGGLGLAPNLPFHRILFPRASRPRASFLFSTSDRVKMALGTRMLPSYLLTRSG